MALTVGFDLDMTLVDSRPGIRASMNALSRETGVRIDVDVVVARLGPKLEWELAQWFPPDQVDQMCERYRRYYWDQCVGSGTVVLSGARRALSAVRARAGRAVVVTAKPEQLASRCLDTVGLDVDDVVGHVHGDEKRDALIAHAAGIYVGDTVTDMRAARDASAMAVGVTTGPDDAATLFAAGADVVFDALDAFPAWLSTQACTARRS
jgi:phosphoglycolate phosphatase